MEFVPVPEPELQSELQSEPPEPERQQPVMDPVSASLHQTALEVAERLSKPTLASELSLFFLLPVEVRLHILSLVDRGDAVALLRIAGTCRWIRDSVRAVIRRVHMTPARRARLEAMREEDRSAAAYGTPAPCSVDLSRLSLFGFLQDCPSLEVLDLGRGAETGSSLDGGPRQRELEQPCVALRALRAIDTGLRADQCLSLSFTELPALTALDLSRNPIGDRGLNVLLMTDCVRHVERLVLQDCELIGEVGNGGDSLLPACTHLDLSGNPISEHFASTLPVLAPVLMTLLLGGCSEVTFLDLSACVTLEKVSVKCMRALETLRLPPQQITTLDLIGLPQLYSKALRTVLEQQHGDRLSSLLLAESMVDAETVQSLRIAFPSLTNLDIRWCEALGGQPEQALVGLLSTEGAAVAPLSSLLCRCLPLIDDAIGAFVTTAAAGHGGCMLRQLDIGRCDALTDSSLSMLAEWALHLTHLNLEWCYHFTDQGVRRIMQRCTNMQFLKLEGCKQITEKVVSLPELQAGRSEPWSPSRRNNAVPTAGCDERSPSPTLPQRPASELRLLNLVYVNDVSDEAIMAFSLAFPKCTVVNYYGDEVLAGTTSENPGTDCGGWDADGGGLDAETVLFGAAHGFD